MNIAVPAPDHKAGTLWARAGGPTRDPCGWKPTQSSDPTKIPDGPEPLYDKVASGYRSFHHPRPFKLEWEGELPEFSLAYESWGTLSPARDNAVLLHTGLSASSHARSHPENTHPDWREDRYYGQSFPHRGLRVAREMGTLTYRSEPEWMERFGCARNEGPPRLTEDFQLESYLA